MALDASDSPSRSSSNRATSAVPHSITATTECSSTLRSQSSDDNRSPIIIPLSPIQKIRTPAALKIYAIRPKKTKISDPKSWNRELVIHGRETTVKLGGGTQTRRPKSQAELLSAPGVEFEDLITEEERDGIEKETVTATGIKGKPEIAMNCAENDYEDMLLDNDWDKVNTLTEERFLTALGIHESMTTPHRDLKRKRSITFRDPKEERGDDGVSQQLGRWSSYMRTSLVREDWGPSMSVDTTLEIIQPLEESPEINAELKTPRSSDRLRPSGYDEGDEMLL